MRGSILIRTSLAAACLLLLPAPVAAFQGTGPCSLTLVSADSKGDRLDTATSGDASATEGDPFLIDWEGTLGWKASTSVPLLDNHFEVSMFGLPTPFQGGSMNTSDSRSSTGAFAFTGNAPFRFTGLYYLTAQIRGSGGTCSGTLVVKLVGDPVGTIPFFVGLGLLVIGGLLLLWGPRGHLVAGLFGGAFLGLSIAILLVIFAVLPLGSITPGAVLAVGGLLGLASAALGWLRLRTEGAALAGSSAENPPALEGSLGAGSVAEPESGVTRAVAPAERAPSAGTPVAPVPMAGTSAAQPDGSAPRVDTEGGGPGGDPA